MSRKVSLMKSRRGLSKAFSRSTLIVIHPPLPRFVCIEWETSWAVIILSTVVMDEAGLVVTHQGEHARFDLVSYNLGDTFEASRAKTYWPEFCNPCELLDCRYENNMSSMELMSTPSRSNWTSSFVIPWWISLARYFISLTKVAWICGSMPCMVRHELSQIPLFGSGGLFRPNRGKPSKGRKVVDMDGQSGLENGAWPIAF